MAPEPYKRGDAIRRPAPSANVCWDCHPIKRWEYSIINKRNRMDLRPRPGEGGLCKKRGCVPGPVIDKLAALARGAP